MPGMKAGDPVTVSKLSLDGTIAWQYEGRVLRREPDAVALEALFDHPDTPFQGTLLKQGDRFVETFYTGRWYNIFEIHDRDDGQVKGWYCNIGRPAVVSEGSVSYVDLALDLWVSTDGKQTVLDEDEFDGLELDEAARRQACAALAELQQAFRRDMG
ncbi:MAG: DUF402 domain-containing protein [Chloroflexi bacterium]|nr:DUF402 domain-containing protein [Chloroflexota bacterium]